MNKFGVEQFLSKQYSFDRHISEVAESLEKVLDDCLPQAQGYEKKLTQAMRYSMLNGGKRFRPFISVVSSELFKQPRQRSLRVGAAIEMVHCYSLIHDDLPALDNDDYRRGHLSCHKAFDEATAILAGDGLLTQAFVVLSDKLTHPDSTIRANLVLAMASAVGVRGMIAGQMLDLIAEDQILNEGEITRMQMLKTGALIGLSSHLGGILGNANDTVLATLKTYGESVGLAFQIADDLLDLESSSIVLGKKVRKDQKAGKTTFVSLLGADRARAYAFELVENAVAILGEFGEEANPLRAAAYFAISRLN